MSNRRIIHFSAQANPALILALVLCGLVLVESRSASFPVEVIALPELRMDGQAARVHTQGLEIVGESFYVTGRREDMKPKRALLLCAQMTATNWDYWDITASAQAGNETLLLDHPGGMQSDGRRFWIPVSQSRPKSRTVIRAYTLEALKPGRAARPETEFPVADHIGAVAVSGAQRLVLGASWDTETVYVWDFEGHLKQTWSGAERSQRGLGTEKGAGGVAVQDWKLVENRLFASGLVPAETGLSRSRWICFTNFFQPDFTQARVTMPREQGIELGREAMALSREFAYFLPEDLGASHRIFRVSLDDLFKATGF